MTNTINIDLWFWRIDISQHELARAQTYLEATERARMSRLVFEKDRNRFAVCRARLRRILGQYTATNPRDVRFDVTGRDKPVLSGNSDIHFNLSHTDGLAGLAVVKGHPVGFDLERQREIDDDFIAYALNPAEYAHVLRLVPTERPSAFLRYWTAKEAFLKCAGTGLWQSLKSFDVTVPLTRSAPGAYTPATLARIDDATSRARIWHLYSFEPAGDYFGALALAPPKGADVNIRTRWLGTNPKPTCTSA